MVCTSAMGLLEATASLQSVLNALLLLECACTRQPGGVITMDVQLAVDLSRAELNPSC